MKNLKLALVALSLCLSGASAARAETYQLPGYSAGYTIDGTTTGRMAVPSLAGGNGIGFGLGGVVSAESSGVSYAEASGTLLVTFQADPGKIFDRLNFVVGVSGGGFTNYWGGYGTSHLDWTVNGGTFVGAVTSGFSNYAGPVLEWQVTGPNTGWNNFYAHQNFGNYGGVAGSGYYAIGASSFSIDFSAFAYATGDGNLYAPGVNFLPTLIDAPIPDPVPEPTTLALVGVATGCVAVRRRWIGRA